MSRINKAIKTGSRRGLLRLGEEVGDKWNWVLGATGCLFGVLKMFSNWCGDVAQLCEHTKSHWMTPFEWVNCIWHMNYISINLSKKKKKTWPLEPDRLAWILLGHLLALWSGGKLLGPSGPHFSDLWNGNGSISILTGLLWVIWSRQCIVHSKPYTRVDNINLGLT